MKTHLFSELKIRDLVFRNRIFVSPMCQYSAPDGIPHAWHMVHLGSRAVGGAGLVMTEATAVCPEGRISPEDTGIWNTTQITAFRAIAEFINGQGAVPGIQLAHAGRKASTDVPWRGHGPLSENSSGWTPLAPSALPFNDGYPTPKAMSLDDIECLVGQFRQAALNSLNAGFRVVEIHMAHGYLVHEFLSPITNQRTNQYGGSLENRTRLAVRIASEIRKVWPAQWPLLARISCSDWVPGGWDITQSIVLCKALKEQGVDLIDCSSGGLLPQANIPLQPGYQVPFADKIRREVGILTGAVGMITEPRQAEDILATGKADVILMARQFLRDPYWPLHAARELGVDVPWPKQYSRA